MSSIIYTIAPKYIPMRKSPRQFKCKRYNCQEISAGLCVILPSFPSLSRRATWLRRPRPGCLHLPGLSIIYPNYPRLSKIIQNFCAETGKKLLTIFNPVAPPETYFPSIYDKFSLDMKCLCRYNIYIELRRGTKYENSSTI